MQQGAAYAPPASAYSQVADGKGGYNYFLNGTTPVTVQQYNQGTGKNVSATATSTPGAVLGDSTTSGSSSGSSAVDPAAAALYNQEAGSYESQLGDLDPVLAQTLSDIGSGYNTAVNSQGQSMADATQDYNTTKGNDLKGETQTLDSISGNTRAQGNALQRLLGLAGSGNSSASEVAAPYLVNQAGATANGQAQTTFGENQQALDTNFARAQRNNQTALSGLAQQEFAAQNQAKASNANQKAGVLQSIITALGNFGSAAGNSQGATSAALQPYIDQLNSAAQAGAGFTGQYAAPVYATNPNVYSAPSLASYNAGVTAAPTTAAAPAPNAGQNVTVAPTQAPKQPSPLLLATA